MSVDLAHSLSDSFDLGRPLFDQNDGHPRTVAPNLDLQEIDVQAEIERNWSDIFRYVADVFTSTGLNGVLAEEVAILPGTEDVLVLAYVNRYVRENAYDVIVLDAPPTAESLRFVSIYSTLEWYMRKRFKTDRGLMRFAGPLLERMAELPMPPEPYFAGLQRLFTSLERVDALLTDPAITTVRLVTAPEQMVVRETKRAYMYFSLFGMTTDSVIVNRILPEASGQLAGWARKQAGYVEQIREHFAPVPVTTLPLLDDEVVGSAGLREVATLLYGDRDPLQSSVEPAPYAYSPEGDGFVLRLPVPFADRESLAITRAEGDVVVRVGSFKRSVPIPRALQRLRTVSARVEGGEVAIRFAQ
jgi:arsenite-transporting ATPase